MGKHEKDIEIIKDQIVKEFAPEKIILFGSYAWGKPTDDSDIDLLIIQNSAQPRSQRQQTLQKKLAGNLIPMDLLIYTPAEIEHSINQNQNLFLEDIFKNGKAIYENPASKLSIKLPVRKLTVLQ